MFHQCSRGLEDTNIEGRHNVLHNRTVAKIRTNANRVDFSWQTLQKNFENSFRNKHIGDWKPSKQLLPSPTTWGEIKRHQTIEDIIWFYKLRFSVTAKVCWWDFHSQLDCATQKTRDVTFWKTWGVFQAKAQQLWFACAQNRLNQVESPQNSWDILERPLDFYSAGNSISMHLHDSWWHIF